MTESTIEDVIAALLRAGYEEIYSVAAQENFIDPIADGRRMVNIDGWYVGKWREKEWADPYTNTGEPAFPVAPFIRLRIPRSKFARYFRDKVQRTLDGR